jgi:peroxiredoxin
MPRTVFSAVLAVLAVGLWTLAPAFAGEEEPKAPEVGDKAIDFSLSVFGTGSKFQLSEKLGKEVVVLAFMQTSCVACRSELMLLRDIVKEKGSGLAVYPISVDYDAEKRLKSYKAFYKFEFPFLMDPEFSVAPLYGYTYTPALVIVDREGKIAMKMAGFHEGDEVKVKKALDKLMPKVAQTD